MSYNNFVMIKDVLNKKFSLFLLSGLIGLVGSCSNTTFEKEVVLENKISAKTSSNLFSVDKNISVVSKIQSILNGTRSFSGDFRQQSSNGDYQSGKIWLKKPGNMRIEYNSGLLLLADGDNLVYYDPSIDQKTLIDLETTPAGVLVKKNIVLEGGDLSVLDSYEVDEKYFVTIALKADAGLGRVEFILDKKTEDILGWTVKDAQGVSTKFDIINYKKNILVANSKFVLKKKKNFGSSGEVENGSDFY
ncbi:MAG: outer-membrane lipoprotein carrier protein LolA [Alphaproteobacteria bacterium]|jgi:outer membrane lipoprotein-sorting protein|nr:outer-membrane lipoprotein carrier protein LolA [Alphaproteobacteria bacterium]